MELIQKEKADFFKHELKVKQGKQNRAKGADFERRVRADLESKNWIVSKWQNNVNFSGKVHVNTGKVTPDYDPEYARCIPAKMGRFRSNQGGFPDFIAYRGIYYNTDDLMRVHFIECKCNGYLDKEEKAKAKWYLENNYCSKFLIAKRVKVNNRITIEYKEFS